MPIPTFALHDLGWFAFQQLCHTVLREVLGQTVQSFLSSRDGGRDGAFHGSWQQKPGERLSGTFVVQCKHTARAGRTLSLSELGEELEKAQSLVRSGECDIYVLMTNAGVSGVSERAIREAFEAVGVARVMVFGADWMNQTIVENPRLRRRVPRLYGLGDLTQILDERSYRQAAAVLDSMRADLSKLVLTATYEKATTALERHGFVLLLGAPATGKTTIAAQLALGAADEFDTAVVKLDTAADLRERWNPDERQLFWLDDAFGPTQYDVTLARAWTTSLPRINSALKMGSKFVLTSRDYVFRAARGSLKPGSFPLFDESQVVVDVHDLELVERQQILYNHLRHGHQSNAWLGEIRPHLDAAAAHTGFTPELARRLGHPQFTGGLDHRDHDSVLDFFARPGGFLHDVMAALDADARAALGLIFVHRDWLSSPVTLDGRSADLVERLGSDLGGVVAALEAMRDSLVRHLTRNGRTGWVFAHPTMSDAYSKLMRSPDLIGHLVMGFPIEMLLREITCGDVGIEGALIVGSPHHPVVMDRLEEPLPNTHPERWREHSRRTTFLATRCDAEFLQDWRDRHPQVVADLANPGLLLQASSENELVVRLHEFALLPEDVRETFVRNVIEYCLDGTDPAVLWDDDLKSLLTNDEWERLLHRVRTILLSNLERAVDNCTEGYRQGDDDPRSFVDPLATLVIYLPDLFPDDEYVRERARDLESLVEEWVEHQGDGESDEGYERSRTEPGTFAETAPVSSRSMFDDLVEGR